MANVASLICATAMRERGAHALAHRCTIKSLTVAAL